MTKAIKDAQRIALEAIFAVGIPSLYSLLLAILTAATVDSTLSCSSWFSIGLQSQP